MFYLDKLFIKWIIAKCTQLGLVFSLSPLEGFIFYLAIFGIVIAKILDFKTGKSK